MLNVLVVGVGGCGNAAAMKLIENKIVSSENVLMINKTDLDIPEGFTGKTCIINSEGVLGSGSAKEREIGKEEAISALQSGKFDPENYINPTTDLVIVIASTEGGTGSGAAVVIAKYIAEVVGCNVHLAGFTGFENDARGLRNTLGFFKDIPDSVSVSIKRNRKYLKGTDYISAEAEADRDFCIEMSILLGNAIKKSTHNIDRADLMKVAALTPGYQVIEYFEPTSKIKNVDSYNACIKYMIDNSKAMDVPQSKVVDGAETGGPCQKALAVIINLPEAETKFIDGDQTVLKNTYGQTYDIFTHIQSYAEMPPFVAFISSGMNIPIDEVDEIYSKYLDSTAKVVKGRDSFFQNVQSFEYDESDSIFDRAAKSRAKGLKAEGSSSKKDFFKSLGSEAPNRSEKETKSDMKEY